MTNIVLVHGAWLGGWIWHEVAGRLRQAGHDVYTPTLTGLGERVHLGRPDVGLDTHVTDIINVLAYEDLHDVVLAGHSYSAIVVQSVADRIPERLSGLIYVDCAPLPDGIALLDLYSEAGRAETEREVQELGDGWKLPFPPLEDLGKMASLAGLDDDALELMSSRATSQPIETYRQKLTLSGGFHGGYARAVIACSEGDFSVDALKAGVESGEPMFQMISDPDWTFHELPTGHWPMLSMPAELSSLLDDLVG